MTLASKRNIKWYKNGGYRGQFNPNFNGGAYIDEKGYMRVLRPEHPHQNKGYVYMHRLIMEEYLGRFLAPTEIIHHINELKCDNRIDNFFLTTVSEHSSIHKSGSIGSMESRTKRRLKVRSKGQRKRNSAGQFLTEPEKGV